MEKLITNVELNSQLDKLTSKINEKWDEMMMLGDERRARLYNLIDQIQKLTKEVGDLIAQWISYI
jgi:hypothetical protein